jgi:hypothetical protein
VQAVVLTLKSKVSNLVIYPKECTAQVMTGSTSTGLNFSIKPEGFHFNETKPVYHFKIQVENQGWTRACSAIPLMQAVTRKLGLRAALALTSRMKSILGEKYKIETNVKPLPPSQPSTPLPTKRDPGSKSAWAQPKGVLAAPIDPRLDNLESQIAQLTVLVTKLVSSSQPRDGAQPA